MEETKESDKTGAKQRRTSPIAIPSKLPKSPSLSDRTNRHSRNKSVQWADWELNNVVDFSGSKQTKSLIDEYSQTEIESPTSSDRVLPLIDSLVQTSLEIGSITSRSRSPSLITCATVEEDEERQTALADLIIHLEDTSALLREYLAPTQVKSDEDDYTKNEQTFFLLKYQILLVSFTQLVSILIFTLIDSVKNELDTGYFALTISCGSILQLLNIVLVAFASTVLSRQMVKYKVEGLLMAQTFVATVITFAGVYFLIYRFDPNNWEFGSADRIEERKAFGQFVKMLYLSVSSSTLCGAANVQPNKWHVTLIVCFQDLINFVYFASILAQTIGNYHSYTVQVKRSASMSHLVSR
ncbi:uncharacterized protein [Parasteatoda tepidariorum]|uniref:uncharacterized protein n=1 Tax=Parasteatoda tepidariorum TaxID=114398 RepID=UPI00077FB795|nr:uncharacterized protein LOC107439836 [Parasteatoda tepidariorum]